MDQITKDDELLILRQGIDSQFWKLVSSKWGKFLDDAMISLLNPKYDNRDFLAGKVRGMRDLLSYPERRINTIQGLQKKEKEQENPIV
jgi:hypothetical protein